MQQSSRMFDARVQAIAVWAGIPDPAELADLKDHNHGKQPWQTRQKLCQLSYGRHAQNPSSSMLQAWLTNGHREMLKSLTLGSLLSE